MDNIIIKKNKFEETIKTIFYELLFESIHQNRKTLAIYDEFRRIVENNDGFIGFDSYDDIGSLEYVEIKNVAIGITTGSNSVAIGYSALISNTTGSNSVAIGYDALIRDSFKQDDDCVFRDGYKRSNDLYDYHYNCWVLNSKLSTHIKSNFKLPMCRDNFFVFCYYLNYHDKDGFTNIKQHIQHYKDFNHTYSPIGATIISKANHNLKQNFIHELLKCGYQPTLNDIDLSLYELYNTIYKKHVDSIMMLYKDNILVRDIHKYISSLLIELWRKDYALL